MHAYHFVVAPFVGHDNNYKVDRISLVYSKRVRYILQRYTP